MQNHFFVMNFQHGIARAPPHAFPPVVDDGAPVGRGVRGLVVHQNLCRSFNTQAELLLRRRLLRTMHLMYYTDEKGKRIYTLKARFARSHRTRVRDRALRLHTDRGGRNACARRRRRLRASRLSRRTLRASPPTTNSPSTA